MTTWFDVWCVLGPTRNVLARWRRESGDDVAHWCTTPKAKARWSKAGKDGSPCPARIEADAYALRQQTNALVGREANYLPCAELPVQWRQVLSSPFLTVAGELPEPGVAIVGTRSITAQNTEHIKERLEQWMQHKPLPVSSGGATGVDTIAHDLALKLGIPVVVVLAGGLLNASPSANRERFWEIAREGGALVTEQAPGYKQRGHDFLKRNKLIVGSAMSVLVVRSDLQGGAMNTARHARELGRPVGIMPGAPWDPNTEGTNSLLNLGARACFDCGSYAKLLQSGASSFQQADLLEWAALRSRRVVTGTPSAAVEPERILEGRSRGNALPHVGDRLELSSPRRSKAAACTPNPTGNDPVAEKIVAVLRRGTATTEVLTREVNVDVPTLQRRLLMMVLDCVVIDGVDGYRLPPPKR